MIPGSDYQNLWQQSSITKHNTLKYTDTILFLVSVTLSYI